MKKHGRILALLLTFCTLVLVGCGGDDDTVTPPPPKPVVDTTSPAAITDLACTDRTAGSVTLGWTATGDDAATGTATSYDVRYALTAIDSAGFLTAFQATGEPTPKLAGQAETFTVTGLVSNTHYYFAIKASDEASNTSAVSNSPDTTTDVPDYFQITTNVASDACPAYSPDGEMIVFQSQRGYGNEIYIKSAKVSGGPATQITSFSDASNAYNSQFPTWSPSGDSLAFSSNVDGTFDIWVVDISGGAPYTPVKITSGGSSNERYPEWSRDGTRIAFSSNFTAPSDIYTVTTSGGGPGTWYRVTNDAYNNEAPTWSNDDSWIAYHTTRDGNYSIFKIRLSDSHIEAVTGTGPQEQFPSWSPDGLYISFDQNQSSGGVRMNISFCPASGGTWTLVSDDPTHVADRWSCWSPDSRRIAYTNLVGNGDVVSERVR